MRGNFEPYIKTTDLQQGHAYTVSNFYTIDTRFGERLVACLDDGNSTILPKRFAEALTGNPEGLDWLNEKKYKMIFRGINISKKNMIMLEFIETL